MYDVSKPNLGIKFFPGYVADNLTTIPLSAVQKSLCIEGRAATFQEVALIHGKKTMCLPKRLPHFAWMS